MFFQAGHLRKCSRRPCGSFWYHLKLWGPTFNRFRPAFLFFLKHLFLKLSYQDGFLAIQDPIPHYWVVQIHPYDNFWPVSTWLKVTDCMFLIDTRSMVGMWLTNHHRTNGKRYLFLFLVTESMAEVRSELVRILVSVGSQLGPVLVPVWWL